MGSRENMEEWGTSASVEQETIRAVVEAYAEGKIELSRPHPKTGHSGIRYAPSFKKGSSGEDQDHLPYTAMTLAKFIGWVEPSGQPSEKVRDGLTALQFIEENILSEEDFDGLSTTQARAVIEQVRKTRKRRETVAKLHQRQAEGAVIKVGLQPRALVCPSSPTQGQCVLGGVPFHRRVGGSSFVDVSVSENGY